MWRALLEPAAFFLAPFILYVVYLLALRRNPAEPAHWPRGAVLGLAIAGLAVAVAAMLAFGFAVKRPKGAYVPAHVENGRVVPGRFE